MTGLDQEMMQKNLSCKNIHDAQKNMFSFSFILFFVNLLFLILGAVLYIYSDQQGIQMPRTSDELFPLIALKHFRPFVGLVFIIGLMAAAYSSADGALTALTTSFSIDFLNFEKRNDLSEKTKKQFRQIVHISFAILLFLVINIFRVINNEAVIKELFTIAGYTYGPLLGMYMLGLFTKINVKDRFVPWVAVVSPVICYIAGIVVPIYFNYRFGFELLILNGSITFTGMLILSNHKPNIERI
jgi:Na+/proline symporter